MTISDVVDTINKKLQKRYEDNKHTSEYYLKTIMTEYSLDCNFMVGVSHTFIDNTFVVIKARRKKVQKTLGYSIMTYHCLELNTAHADKTVEEIADMIKARRNRLEVIRNNKSEDSKQKFKDRLSTLGMALNIFIELSNEYQELTYFSKNELQEELNDK